MLYSSLVFSALTKRSLRETHEGNPISFALMCSLFLSNKNTYAFVKTSILVFSVLVGRCFLDKNLVIVFRTSYKYYKYVI